jgi:hypothetical protein
MKSFNPALEYTGVDINPEFVEIARRSFPASHFYVGDGIHFDSAGECYDLVHSSGILHLNTQYEKIVASCYAQSRKYVACDFRLTFGPRVQGTCMLEFQPSDGARPLLPYIVLNVNELVTMLSSLRPPPGVIRLRGYYHPPSPMADLPLTRVLMTAVLIEKQPGHQHPQVMLEMPPATPDEPERTL